MKRMLINATQEEELRVAIVDGQKLYDLDIEVESSRQKKANIYLGTITRLEPSLDAAFVDYGAERHGFLPLKDISREYFTSPPEQGQRINIREVLREGQKIVVQVDKDERGSKGAALTTFISLAGRFIVLMPNNPRGGGVSRRIAGDDREEIRRVQRQLNIPDGMSCIVRTAGIGRSIEELEWDLEYLRGIWDAILKVVESNSQPAPFLMYQDSSPVIRALRDHFNTDIGEIIIDDDKALTEARDFMQHVMPHNLRKLKNYEEDVPLFTRFQIESQIESAFAHDVNLPSGGSIVIDHTEALVSIDINSARATKGGDIEATALATNLEAAEEIARQCRIRDLGGLLVIDFIDMGPSRNQREVENKLRESVKTDRARVQIGRISRFGLLEMSRQRLRRSLDESTNQVCPRCNGSGVIRGVESLGLAILRLVGEEARKDRTAKVIAELPVDVATFLLNEKRSWIQSIEERTDVELLLVANPGLETPNYTIRRVRDDQTLLSENTGSSYTLTTPEGDLLEDAVKMSSKTKTETPAVSTVVPTQPAPAPVPATPGDEAGGGVFGWVKNLFSSDSAEEEDEPQRKSDRNKRQRGDENRNRSRRSESNRQGRGRRGRGRDENKSRKQNSDSGSKKRGNRNAQANQKNQPKQTNQNNQGNQSNKQAGDEAASGNSGRRRRRRRRSGKGRGDANTSGENTAKQNSNEAPPNTEQPQKKVAVEAKDDHGGNEGNRKPDHATEKSAPVAAKTEQAKPDSSQENANQSKSQGNDKDRLLPWETAGGKDKSDKYTVWSSDDSS